MKNNSTFPFTENNLSQGIFTLESLVTKITNEQVDFKTLDEDIRSLEKLIFDFDSADQDICDKFFNDLTPETIKEINDAYCRWETEHETRFAELILEDKVKVEEYLLFDRFKDLVKNELELLDGRAYNSIMFIGSGPFPITAIFLHRYTGKVIDCLEISEEAAEISLKILKKLGLENSIRIHVGNGCTYDLGNYDVILNALLAKPKIGILKNIRLTNKDVNLLCRTSYGLRRLVYEPTPHNVTLGFNKVSEQIADRDFTISTMYLINRVSVTDNLNYKWITSLDNTEKDRLSDMMNDIISRDNNNGFLTLMNRDHVYMKVLEKDISAGTKYLLVVENEGVYLGQFIIEHSYVETYKKRAEVSTLMINPSVRGKDVSIKIIENLFEKCDELDIKYITLTVRAGSKVELLWRHLGFEKFGELPCYSSVGEKQYTGIYMYKDVESLKRDLYRKMESLYAVN